MHYSVLVLGDDPEGALAPYSERYAELRWQDAGHDYYQELITTYGTLHTEKDRLEIAMEHGAEDVEQTPGGELRLGYGFNPEGRWDWYVPGGRWEGILPTSPDHLDEEGKPSKGLSVSTLGEVMWTPEVIRLVHSLIVDGEWHDLDHTDPEGAARQFEYLTEGLESSTAVHVIDCHQ